MGQKDLWQCDYFDSNVRFADIYNGIFFGGNTIIKPEELEPEDSVLVRHFQNTDSAKVICDKVRKWKGHSLAILPLENQSYIDYRMVLRAMQEEVLLYEKQRKADFEELKQKNYTFDSNEFLSKMARNQKFTPVIPLVLYLGNEKPWDGARHLHDLLKLDDRLKPFVNDYKINLYDYHNEKDFSVFKTENRLLFEVLSHADDKEKVAQIFQKEAENYTLDKEAATALLGMVGIQMDLDKLKEEKDGKVEYKMCKAFQEITQEARNDGYSSGKNDGIHKGISDSIQALMETMNLTLEQAMDALKISEEQRRHFYS